MPIVVWHENAADALQPAANAGNFAAGLDVSQDNRAWQELQNQQLDIQQRERDRQTQIAQENALRAAALAQQQQIATQRMGLQGQLGEDRNNTRVNVAQIGADARGASDQAAMNRAQMNADQRAQLSDQIHQNKLDEQQAAQAGQYDKALQLQQQRQASEQQLQQAQNDFRKQQQQQAQQNAALMQDQRMKEASARGNSLEFQRQKTIHEGNLRTLNEQIGQLQKQATVVTDPNRQHAIEKQIEDAMTRYQAAANDYNTWLNSVPGSAPATQPAAQPAAMPQPTTQPAMAAPQGAAVTATQQPAANIPAGATDNGDGSISYGRTRYVRGQQNGQTGWVRAN